MSSVSSRDVEILRRLASTYVEAAALPVHKRTSDLWRRLNGLEPVRPLVWINEIPWHEMALSGELDIECEDSYCREVEWTLRSTLYQWKHFPCDMVLDAELYVQTVCQPVGVYADYGISANETHPADSGGSSEYKPVIAGLDDVAKLRTPDVKVDWDESHRRLELLSDACAGIVPVKLRGIVHQWMSPWDQMIHWYGIERLYTDMIDRPDLVHALAQRFMAAVHDVLDRQQELGLLDAGNGNYRVGSGGLGITDLLPHRDFGSGPVSPTEQWGTSTGQIFCDVSPAMHDEFCLQYEIPYLARFGLTCYGCCEPLHNKIPILRQIKNLRRISMSPWVKIAKAAEQVQADYVFSFKPTPAVFAADVYDGHTARRNLEDLFEKAKGCRLEIIMKDISTVRNQPQRIDEWAAMAMRMSADYAEANGLDG
jgi:hypothetical protein